MRRALRWLTIFTLLLTAGALAAFAFGGNSASTGSVSAVNHEFRAGYEG